MNNVRSVEGLWLLIAPLLLAMPRILAAVTVAPLFPQQLFPVLLRNVVTVSLALGIYPHLAVQVTSALGPVEWLVLIGKEIFIGALLGFAVGILIWAMESVGTIIDIQVGYGNASLFDPFGGHQAGPLSGMMSTLAVVLFVTTGGLQVLTSLLYESFSLWPVGEFYPSMNRWLADLGAETLGSLGELIARLAAPVIVLLVMIDLAFGLVGRVVSQLNVFYFTMPIKGAVAALMMAIYVAHLADIASAHVAELPHWLERLAAAFTSQ